MTRDATDIARRAAATLAHLPATRREFLRRSGTGFGALALADLLAGGGHDALASATAASLAHNPNPMHPKAPHFAPRAKAVIHLFLNGGP
ncbi:MAG TPA: hypothetical protein DC048_05765, partial [Planctomycetaceae bacterium]|nr:hypothetical protein [Planctomycetaceae bacterium]